MWISPDVIVIIIGLLDYQNIIEFLWGYLSINSLLSYNRIFLGVIVYEQEQDQNGNF